MKNIYDFSALDAIAESEEIKQAIKDTLLREAEKSSVSFREHFFTVPISGNDSNGGAFEFVSCYVCLHLKRIYSTKTWKPIKNIYTVEAYNLSHATRKCIYDAYDRIEHTFKAVERPSDIECVDTNGNIL